MFTVKILESISEEIIQKAIEMDHAAFPMPDWIAEEDAHLIYRNPDTRLIWLTRQDEPAGFITIFPISDAVPARAVEKNKPIYKLLTRSALEEAGTPVLYCHCFLLLPRFRGRGLIYPLYEGLGRWLMEKGGAYPVLYADAVSQEGRRCLERLGFAPVHSFGSQGVLYQADRKRVIQAAFRE